MGGKHHFRLRPLIGLQRIAIHGRSAPLFDLGRHPFSDYGRKLEQMVRESGRPADELVEDAIIGYFDELAYTRLLLNRRYDDLENGSVNKAHRR